MRTNDIVVPPHFFLIEYYSINCNVSYTAPPTIIFRLLLVGPFSQSLHLQKLYHTHHHIMIYSSRYETAIQNHTS